MQPPLLLFQLIPCCQHYVEDKVKVDFECFVESNLRIRFAVHNEDGFILFLLLHPRNHAFLRSGVLQKLFNRGFFHKDPTFMCKLSLDSRQDAAEMQARQFEEFSTRLQSNRAQLRRSLQLARKDGHLSLDSDILNWERLMCLMRNIVSHEYTFSFQWTFELASYALEYFGTWDNFRLLLEAYERFLTPSTHDNHADHGEDFSHLLPLFVDLIPCRTLNSIVDDNFCHEMDQCNCTAHDESRWEFFAQWLKVHPANYEQADSDISTYSWLVVIRLMRNVLCHEYSYRWRGLGELAEHCVLFFGSLDKVTQMISYYKAHCVFSTPSAPLLPSLASANPTLNNSHILGIQLYNDANCIILPQCGRFLILESQLLDRFSARLLKVKDSVILKSESVLLILIFGPPSSGRTSVARYLVPHLMDLDVNNIYQDDKCKYQTKGLFIMDHRSPERTSSVLKSVLPGSLLAICADPTQVSEIKSIISSEISHRSSPKCSTSAQEDDTTPPASKRRKIHTPEPIHIVEFDTASMDKTNIVNASQILADLQLLMRHMFGADKMALKAILHLLGVESAFIPINPARMAHSLRSNIASWRIRPSTVVSLFDRLKVRLLDPRGSFGALRALLIQSEVSSSQWQSLRPADWRRLRDEFDREIASAIDQFQNLYNKCDACSRPEQSRRARSAAVPDGSDTAASKTSQPTIKQPERVSRGHWKSPENRRAFLDLVGKSLGVVSMDNWYNVTKNDVISLGGGGMLQTYYSDSLIKALKSIYSEHTWEDWRFQNAVGGWKQVSDAAPGGAGGLGHARTRSFFDRLGAKLFDGVDEKDRLNSWYSTLASVVIQNGGAALLRANGNSLRKALMNAYPEHNWEEERFLKLPPSYWADVEKHKQLFDAIAKDLGIQSLEDWYNVHTRQVLKAGALSVLPRYYSNSLLNALRALYPDHEWLEWRFPRTPVGFWDSLENQRRYLDWVARERLGFEPTDFERWYKIFYDDVAKHGGYRMLAKFYNYSLLAALKAVYPEHKWHAWKISKVSANFWTDLRAKLNSSNNKQSLEELESFVNELELRLSIQRPDDWYRISLTQLRRIGALHPVQDLGGLPAMLQWIYPDMDWDGALFLRPTKKSAQRELLNVVKSIFPSEKVLEDFILEQTQQPAEGGPAAAATGPQIVEIDIFLPDKMIGFEFQGQHHYSDVTTAGFQVLRQNTDSSKASICSRRGITLISVPFWWDFDAESLQNTIHQVRPDLVPNPVGSGSPIPNTPPVAAERSFSGRNSSTSHIPSMTLKEVAKRRRKTTTDTL